MLKGINPLLNADVLQALAAMGHGDRIVVADANFPAASIARRTAHGSLLRIDAGSAEVVRALLSVLPLDSFIPDAAQRMEVVGKPAEILPVMQEVQAEIDRAEGKAWPLVGLERFAFYEQAKSAYAVLQTAERRFYGCFIFSKGVIPPETRA